MSCEGHRIAEPFLIPSPHGDVWWSSPAAVTGRQQDRPDGVLPEIPERDARTRRSALARRTRAADLRGHFRRSLEDVGRADEDDPQRVSPDAVAERGAGARAETHGGFLLRRGSGAASGLRPATDEAIASSFQLPASIDSAGRWQLGAGSFHNDFPRDVESQS